MVEIDDNEGGVAAGALATTEAALPVDVAGVGHVTIASATGRAAR
jgi:hypothetical protein